MSLAARAANSPLLPLLSVTATVGGPARTRGGGAAREPVPLAAEAAAAFPYFLPLFA